LLKYQVLFFGVLDGIFVEPPAEVIEGPFADIEFAQVTLAQGIGYLVIKVILLQKLLVGIVVKVLDKFQGKEDVHRFIGAAVILAIKVRKLLFVYPAKNVFIVDRRPTLL